MNTEFIRIHMHSAAVVGDPDSMPAPKVGPGSGTPLGSSREETMRISSADPVESRVPRIVYRIDR